MNDFETILSSYQNFEGSTRVSVTLQNIRDNEQEIDKWKAIAAYLASCHAATLESLPKSTSQYSRNRLVSICEKAMKFLRGEELPPHYRLYHDSYGKDWVVAESQRCENAIKEYGSK